MPSLYDSDNGGFRYDYLTSGSCPTSCGPKTAQQLRDWTRNKGFFRISVFDVAFLVSFAGTVKLV